MERRELIERLVPLIPPPRAHQVRYHGILAPSASMRDRIVPLHAARPLEGKSPESVLSSRPSAAGASQMRPLSPLNGDETSRPRGRPGDKPDTAGTSGRQRHELFVEPHGPGIREHSGRMRWATLLQRIFEVDALRCPRCGSTMRLIAVIEDPEVARRILECLELPARAPPLGAVAEPHDEPERTHDAWFFDQSAGADEP